MATIRKRFEIVFLTAMALSGAQPAHAITLAFSNNTSPAAFGLNPDTSGASNTTALPAGFELRWIDPVGIGGGGGPQPNRDVYIGGETWVFNDSGLLAAAGGTPLNTGATKVGDAPGNGSSAAPTAGTNPTIGQSYDHFSVPFNFLAPTTGSLAGATYGPAELALDLNAGTISVLFPVLEGQWVADGTGWWFPLGANQSGGDTLGVLFDGTIAPLGGGLFSFRMQAQETVNNIQSFTPGAGDLPDEDPVEAAFNGWTLQWDVVGTFNAPVPVPAAVWLFSSGLLGLIGIARGRKAA